LRLKSKQESPSVEKIDLQGFSMKVIPKWNAISDEILLTKNYEPHVSKHVAEAVKPGMIFVDIGANIGFYSMLAGSLGAKVEAFEPHSRNVWLLENNVRLNGFEVAIHAVALADANRLFLYSPIGGNGQISELMDTLPDEEQQLIRASTLDEELEGKAPSVIKIDVEGAEGLVMRGGKRSLDARPIVFSEFNASSLNLGPVSASEYLGEFSSRGYKFSLCRKDGVLEPVSRADLERMALESPHGYVDFAAFPP